MILMTRSDDPELDDELPQPNPKLPPLYAHGDPDPRPLKSVADQAADPGCAAMACYRASGAPAKPSSCSIWP